MSGIIGNQTVQCLANTMGEIGPSLAIFLTIVAFATRLDVGQKSYILMRIVYWIHRQLAGNYVDLQFIFKKLSF